MEFNEEDFLMLSGVQHFAFCRRQWGLIHIEQLWQENYLTASGRLMHENAHDPFKTETRGNIIIARAVPVFSRELGLSGECDVVEFHKNVDGVALPGRQGKFIPYPIEYKRGAPKSEDCDISQLMAQAICLEEMMLCQINQGAVFYGATKKRLVIDFSQELRQRVKELCREMHSSFARGYVEKAKPSIKCKACSVSEQCLPSLSKIKSAEKYNIEAIDGEL